MISRTIITVIWFLSHINGFTLTPPISVRQSTALFSTDQETVPIILNGQNIELTPALEDYVRKRIGGTLQKLANSGSVRECDVVLSVTRNPKVRDGHRVEVVTNLKGTTIICKNESPDMYASIDSAAAALKSKLRKYKERRMDGWHGGANMGADLSAALESLAEVESVEEVQSEDEGFEDPEKKEIMKVNSFQLDKPISVEEAIFALDYVDHDFYVFTNDETGKINVVYKRHTGGIGLVEP